MTDKRKLVFDNRLADDRGKPTLEHPTGDACERRVVADSSHASTKASSAALADQLPQFPEGWLEVGLSGLPVTVHGRTGFYYIAVVATDQLEVLQRSFEWVRFSTQDICGRRLTFNVPTPSF